MKFNRQKLRHIFSILPVDRLLVEINNTVYASLDDAKDVEGRLVRWLTRRHRVSLLKQLPNSYAKQHYVLKSGFQLIKLKNPEGYKVVMEYSPKDADSMHPLLPTGHPCDPAAYRLLVAFPEISEIDKNDLKLEISNGSF